MKLFTTSIRNLYKFKLYTIINIVGLAISLACVIIIMRYVHQETTVNHFAKDLDRTYMMSVEEESGRKYYSSADNRNNESGFSNPLDDESVERYSTFIPFVEDNITSKDIQFKVKLLVTDNNFLEMLPYPILYGTNLTDAPDEAILTKGLAQKIFGMDNPIGKTIAFSTGDILRVVGVINEPSSKSFLEFDLLVNINLNNRRWRGHKNNLVMLNLNNDVDRVNKSNSNYMYFRDLERSVRFQLVPLKEFYFDKSRTLYNEGSNPIFLQGNLYSIKILSIISLLILFVGIFNFINIYSVINMKREREFGIKKIYGASLQQIASQFLIENLIMVLVAIFFAWFLTEVSSTVLADRLAFSVKPNMQFDVLLSISILLLLSIVVSVYPFIRYTKSSPITSLRSVNVSGVSVVSRKAFLFMQYIISFGLIIVSMFFVKQLNYMLNTEPGYKTENVIIATMKVENHALLLDKERRNQFLQQIENDKYQTRHRIDNSPLFTEWVFGYTIYDLKYWSKFKNNDQNEFQEVALEWLSPEYFKMFDFQLTDGSLWDSTDVYNNRCIINETAKKRFGIINISSEKLYPDDDTWFSIKDADVDTNHGYEIVGVIKDFNIGHLSKEDIPLVIMYNDNLKGFSRSIPILARFVPGKEKEAAEYLKGIYKEINNSDDFTYTLLEDDIASLYEEDKRISNVYTFFALLAVLVSSMGLFALSLFDIQQRYREIALRKINGATSKDIMKLVLNKYIYLLAGAFAVAIPLSYFAISKYIEGFAHRTTISWWLFAIAAIVVAAISLITLMWQVNVAMKINPTRVLKGE